ncbi:diaminopimelate decarboxylase [Candidatus Kaiserbacteria bacterium CG10_big_fil_rev_8_21_14_0_10_51_14]|uniref:Diaminopimelate decarboxylase n=1 Tax=Candidatus Kaiserbacteria bacterium CG10_big_fil_rev_8_21_14_0_10_51_14 TaxID=1974610 RepID=A0A2H0UBK5_9BACT|nr:MAG: diaminopimelate decarboxylase [Candidatus Kaiserbacteria bacterium CG10_big_fil_rev_8_21_14_0_10_51_14]
MVRIKQSLINERTARVLIQKYGSPLYVYRRRIVEKRYRNLLKAIRYPRTKIYYACKANANKEILQLLKRLGASIECVSRGEVERAMSVGFPRNRISYTCSYIPREELAWVKKKVGSVHLDSLQQLQWWGEINPGSNVSLRVNRGFGAGATRHIITGGPESKFGIYYTDLRKAQQIAERFNLKIIGLEQHIGSSILEPQTFIRAMSLLLKSAEGFPDLQFMDFGGGFGIPYRPNAKPLDIQALGKKMGKVFRDFCKKYGRELELRIEPGRYIVAEAGTLLTTAVDRKQTPGHTFVGVDSGFSHLVRPAFYGSYHHIFNLSNPNGRKETVNVVGNLCESSDVFAKNRSIPKARFGDILLFADAGAYGYSMASDYNLRPKPKEIVLQ